ncbi:MAG: glutathione-regulated potassium-efflux system protein KefC [SAR324 cluster bacterium]|nr:glutathione-regulated potassium-efflux system protein KefC [SAR324 cluster bacterium]
MHDQGFFFQAFIYLLAAVLSVPLAKRLGLGSVLGYLVAGVVIGPFVLGLVGEEQSDVLHFAEFGVVMMLFLIGLELQPSLLWKMRGSILGLGGLQVLITTLIIAGVSRFFGLSWMMAAALGMILALSSTAIVLQTLNEKGLMPTHAGQSSFSVLLFQDIAVIPMLALLPLMASPELLASVGGKGNSGSEHAGLTATLAGWQQALLVLAVVAVIVVAGRFLLRPVFRFIAETRLHEVFTAASLLIVVGIALLMQLVGLSPALGTFLAGVVLAESEYRHELETDLDPFKGLLLGLFFISVGASIDFLLLLSQPWLILGLVFGLVIIKFAVLFFLAIVFKLELSQNFLFSFALAQGGEFAFVLFSFAVQNHVLPADTAQLCIVVVALSMITTPLLMMLNESLIQPLFANRNIKSREADQIDEKENPVIIAGFGRFGQIVVRLLKANNIRATVLDHDPGNIEMLRRFGWKVFYGDAGRIDLLRNAGAEQAKLLIVAIDDKEHAVEMIKLVRKHFPHLRILARAVDRPHAYELLKLGIDEVYRETFSSSLEMGVGALRILGFRAHQAHRMAQVFRRHDEGSLKKLAPLWGNEKAYLQGVHQYLSDLEGLLNEDSQELHLDVDPAWSSNIPREDDHGT